MALAVGVAGWLGTVLLLAAYALLTARRLTAAGWVYQSMNLVGGLGLLANTAFYSAWPSAALNVAWFGIGLVGLIQSRRRHETPLDQPEQAVEAAADPARRSLAATRRRFGRIEHLGPSCRGKRQDNENRGV